jgi:hypothetical protein
MFIRRLIRRLLVHSIETSSLTPHVALLGLPFLLLCITLGLCPTEDQSDIEVSYN